MDADKTLREEVICERSTRRTSGRIQDAQQNQAAIILAWYATRCEKLVPHL